MTKWHCYEASGEITDSKAERKVDDFNRVAERIQKNCCAVISDGGGIQMKGAIDDIMSVFAAMKLEGRGGKAKNQGTGRVSGSEKSNRTASIGVIVDREAKPVMMTIVSLHGFEPNVPVGYISSKRPWVVAHYDGLEPGCWLQLGEPVDGHVNIHVGDVLNSNEFNHIYRYILKAGNRYGTLKRRDRRCHHVVERFEV